MENEFFVGLFDIHPEKEGAREPDYSGYKRVPLGGVSIENDVVKNLQDIQFPGVPKDWDKDWRFTVGWVGIFVGGEPGSLFASARLNRDMDLFAWPAIGPLIPQFSAGELVIAMDEDKPKIVAFLGTAKEAYEKMIKYFRRKND